MPAPFPDAMKQLVRAKFCTFQLKVPSDWKQPEGEAASQFNGAFKDNELVTPPDTPLFLPATMNKYHTDAQREANKNYGDFMDGISAAICDAWSQWQKAATLVTVMINASMAAGGQVVGPPWAPLILAKAPMANPFQVKHSTAIANALSTAWLTYTASIKVPGLPWYPAFLASPGPIAPPMPNIPAPLQSLVQVPVSLAPAILAQQMFGLYADPTTPFTRELFEAIADGFDKCFKIWQSSTMITNVMGTGPVPTFAPPLVPVGPVVGGFGNMTPGGFV
jgi:hypothetical protein